MHTRRREPVKSAYEIAMGRLTLLLEQPLPSGTEADTFFVELSGIVREYLENRFQLSAPELTTEEFLDEASTSRDLSRPHQQLLRDFLRRADLVKFAGLQPRGEDVVQSLSAAEKFLAETRDGSEASSRPAGEERPQEMITQATDEDAATSLPG